MLSAAGPSTLLRDRFPAMGTYFEALLVDDRQEDDDDPARVRAVARMLWDEVARVERMLSRFDPAAEVARLNREAGHRAVRTSVEMANVLVSCEQYRNATGGFFDVALGAGQSSGAVEFDADNRTIRFAHPDVRLDFGGFGKGYALDRLRPILCEHGITRALVHGGTSSVLAIGTAPDGRPWPVALRDPFSRASGRDEDAGPAFGRLHLSEHALSCSAAFTHQGASDDVSDVIDASTGRPLARQAACVVLDRSAAAAEVWSTACLAMGRDRAAECLQARSGDNPERVGWILRSDGVTGLAWL